jgi:hypothetical protein
MNMYKEKVGATAVRKSSKIRDIIENYVKRLPNISSNDEFVNYSYFLVRLIDFDISGRVNQQTKQNLVSRAAAAAVEHGGKSMSFDDLLRLFADLSQIDPVLPLANKI